MLETPGYPPDPVKRRIAIVVLLLLLLIVLAVAVICPNVALYLSGG